MSNEELVVIDNDEGLSVEITSREDSDVESGTSERDDDFWADGNGEEVGRGKGDTIGGYCSYKEEEKYTDEDIDPNVEEVEGVSNNEEEERCNRFRDPEITARKVRDL